MTSSKKSTGDVSNAPDKKGQPQVLLDIPEQILQSDSGNSTSSDEEDEDNISIDWDRVSETLGEHKSQFKVATNREAYGTWNRPSDFLVVIIGYIIGIHNFFRFPHLCYRFGTITFLIPYTLMMILIGVPAIFMECTIGQFYGVGCATAFRQLAPITTGVSYLLAWNSFMNCWMYGILLTWIRSYSGDSLSCLKGWMGCYRGHYFNTPHCYTAVLDDCCTGLSNSLDSELCPEELKRSITNIDEDPFDVIYYNYKCVPLREFCEYFGWTHFGNKQCKDANGKIHSAYERRTHATNEYLYGFVLGMRKVFVESSAKISKNKICAEAKQEAIDNKDPVPLTDCRDDDRILSKIFTNPNYTIKFWKDKGQHMQVDPESSAFIQLPSQAITTVIFLTFFLFVDLLSVSGVTYVMSTVPFVILLWTALIAVGFHGSAAGINDILSLRGIDALWSSLDLWVNAIIQVILTSGIGNGALVSLASFNKIRHSYLFDILAVTILNVVTSLTATLIYFCTIGHMISEYLIPLPFEKFLKVETAYSSVDFGYIVNSLFLTLIDGRDYATLLYFFMLSSFPTDTTIRLAQNMLDMAVQVLPRLRHHPTMALFATTFFFLVSLLPLTRNGGITLFLEFEYCVFHFATPLVTLIEVVSVAWVYKASRLMDDAEMLAVKMPVFRVYIIFCLQYFTPIALVALVIINIATPLVPRIKVVTSYDTSAFTPLVGWVFSLTPIILFTLSVLKQLTAVSKHRWRDLLNPMIKAEHILRKARLDQLQNEYEQESSALPPLKNKKNEDEYKKENEIMSRRLTKVKIEDTLKIIVDEAPKEAESAETTNHLKHHKHHNHKDGDGHIDDGNNLKPVEEEMSNSTGITIEEPEPDHGHDHEDATTQEPAFAPDDKISLTSSEVAMWRQFIFWNELVAHLEDWPDRLDDSEVESDGSSVDSENPDSDDEVAKRKKSMGDAADFET